MISSAALLLLFLVLRVHKSVGMIIFCASVNDARAIWSSIERSLEIYRRSLTHFMQAVESTLLKMAPHKRAIPKTYSLMASSGMMIADLFERNEEIIRMLCTSSRSGFLRPTIGITSSSSSSSSSTAVDELASSATDIAATYTTVDQLLVHLLKDWSGVSTAAQSRQSIYGSTLSLLESETVQTLLAAATPGGSYRALVPGGGLGRLALELIAASPVGKYSVEINELSPLMTAAFATLINETLPQFHLTGQTHKFYPLLTFPLFDDWNFDNRLIPHDFPSADASHIARWAAERASAASTSSDGDTVATQLVFQYGAFQNVYSSAEHFERFDIIITCFFIDTAADLMTYVSTIKNLLRIGGVWVNTGPLHYHDKSSVPYSYSYFISMLREVGFEIVSQSTVGSTYAGEQAYSMRPEYYSCCLDVYRLVSREGHGSAEGDEDSIIDEWHHTEFVLLDG